MGEGGGRGWAPVVGASPWREPDAAALTSPAELGEAVGQRRECLARKRLVEEFGLGEAVSLPRQRPVRGLLDLVVGDAELGLVGARVDVRQLFADLGLRFEAGARHQYFE